MRKSSRYEYQCYKDNLIDLPYMLNHMSNDGWRLVQLVPSSNVIGRVAVVMEREVVVEEVQDAE